MISQKLSHLFHVAYTDALAIASNNNNNNNNNKSSLSTSIQPLRIHIHTAYLSGQVFRVPEYFFISTQKDV